MFALMFLVQVIKQKNQVSISVLADIVRSWAVEYLNPTQSSRRETNVTKN